MSDIFILNFPTLQIQLAAVLHFGDVPWGEANLFQALFSASRAIYSAVERN
jgi:hypothetical protein